MSICCCRHLVFCFVPLAMNSHLDLRPVDSKPSDHRWPDYARSWNCLVEQLCEFLHTQTDREAALLPLI
jgi:hypothetical protein